MKKLLLLLVFTGCTVFSYAQEENIFPLSGAKWTEVETYSYNDKAFYFCYETIGDTIIDGIKHGKIYQTTVDGKYPYLIGTIRIEGKKVICETGDEDYVLYDFGLGKGDTLCHFSSYPFDYSETILDVDTIKLLNNVERKLYRFDGRSREVIEGVGSTKGLFAPMVYDSDDTNYKTFISFSLNGEVLYLNPEYPEWANGKPDSVAELPALSPVHIYTDPISGTFRVISGEPISRISVYNTQGRLFKETSCGGELEYVIDSKGLSAGIYIVKVRMQNGTEETVKAAIK
ncbi:hypothetical protein Barb7_01682 [Bacteroidales bacterium Barb7]|nr:hypothetical protein Barb7_01682 [Bacteroidales bacterium Barb7]